MNTSNGSLKTQNKPSGKATTQTSATVAVRWLLVLALVYTLYFAKSLLVPVLVALLLALLTSPLVALLKRLHIPRTLSALLILCAMGGPLTLLTIELAQPAQKWALRLPELSAFMSEQLNSLTPTPRANPAATAPTEPEKKGFSLRGLFSSDDPEPVPEAVPAEKTGGEVVSEKILESGMEAAFSMLVATPVVIAQVMTCVILFLFLLIFGPKLFEVAMEVSTKSQDKERTIALVTTLRRHLSRYIVTVSIINSCLGGATALSLWLMGMEDALLWGVLVAAFNFAPYIGPLLMIGILCLAGVAQYGLVTAALMPALVYLALNVVEAQLVTPMVLGHNMRLNPLVVMLWLVILGWLWGASGVLLAVPLLVCIKLIAEALNIAPGWIRILESKI